MDYYRLNMQQFITHWPHDEPLDISDCSRIPAFDLLYVCLPADERDRVLAFALRFLRVRRPAAFLLVDEAIGDNVDTEFLTTVGAQTQRLGYRIHGRGAFVIGTLWLESFAWPDEITAQTVLAQVAREAIKSS